MIFQISFRWSGLTNSGKSLNSALHPREEIHHLWQTRIKDIESDQRSIQEQGQWKHGEKHLSSQVSEEMEMAKIEYFHWFGAWGSNLLTRVDLLWSPCVDLCGGLWIFVHLRTSFTSGGVSFTDDLPGKSSYYLFAPAAAIYVGMRQCCIIYYILKSHKTQRNSQLNKTQRNKTQLLPNVETYPSPLLASSCASIKLKTFEKWETLFGFILNSFVFNRRPPSEITFFLQINVNN